jgi:23S rRNA (guanosine2251-2'-O)-methyltransferase
MNNPSNEQLIMGLHAIQEVLKHAPKRLLKVFTSVKKGKQERKGALLEACEEKGVPVQHVSFDLLTKMTGSDSHQSFVAQVQGRRFLSAKEFLLENEDKESLFVLMLDEIHDPQNFGALLRSAECFGVDAVAWSKNRGCDLSPSVAKASCGASELVPLLRVSNLAETAEQFKKEGFEVIAAVADPEAKPLFSYTYAPRTLLIVGSEGEGIQPLLRKKADRLVYIPLSGKIQSLNVAQATAVLLASRLRIS